MCIRDRRVLGSTPETTEVEGGQKQPISPIPKPSLIAAIALIVEFCTLSARLVVDAEQLVGCLGMPTTPSSLRLIAIRLKEPAFLGTELSMELNMPIIVDVLVHASETFKPQASASGFSVKSTSIVELFGEIFTLDVIVIPSFGVPGIAS